MGGLTECRACKGKHVKQFFDLGKQPFANALLVNSEEDKKYPLSLSFCEDCSLVQLDYTADPEELFSNYFWVTATSSTARAYAKDFYKAAVKHMNRQSKSYVLEIASNDGTFLKEFKEKGIEVLGVDPAHNIAEKANSEGINTKIAFFNKEVADDIIAEKGYPSIVYARNVLPHVADLHGFMEGLQSCCNEENLLILEVHYSGKIIDELHYDSIYHEHLCYFTLTSLTNLLKQYGLYAFDIMDSPISGGSIVLYIQKKEGEKSQKLNQLADLENKKNYNSLKKWINFGKMAGDHRKKLLDLIREEKAAGKKIIGYGASARSSTMMNFCKIDWEQIDKVIDQNVMKQGRFTPGTHIEIVSPEEAFSGKPDVILLLAWNFKDEIVDDLINKYQFSGKIIMPLPYPPCKILI